jgi:hypothetical protein
MRFKGPSQRTKNTAIYYIRVVALLVVLLLMSEHRHAHAATPSCRNTGASSKHATIGSQVDGDLVTICLDASFRKKLLQAAKPKPPVKRTVPARPKTKATPKAPVKPKSPAKPKAPVKPKPIVKPRPAPKVLVKPKPRATAKALAERAVFKPHTSQISVTPASGLKPGQLATFQTSPKQVYGNGKLLGRPVLVRFTPVSLQWSFGDGAKLESAITSPRTTHGYLREGTYLSLLHTTFSVAYRLSSGRWLADPDHITLASSPVRVIVGDAALAEARKVVLLTSP